jgi:hypothetical protein
VSLREDAGAHAGLLNPHYGSGVFRREIRLWRIDAQTVGAAVEDEPHAFGLRLTHDEHRVTGVNAEALRYPLTTCPGATGALHAIVGAPLDARMTQLKRHADPRSNCTHLFDLASLAVALAARGEESCTYRIEIPDMIEGRHEARLDRDTGRVLTWEVHHGTIEAPAPYAGRQILGGFTRWATQALEGEALEYALVLARGYFVGLSRLYDMEKTPLGPASEDPMPSGVCWSYSSPQAEHAYRIRGSRRDFSDTPDALLRWVRPEE